MQNGPPCPGTTPNGAYSVTAGRFAYMLWVTAAFIPYRGAGTTVANSFGSGVTGPEYYFWNQMVANVRPILANVVSA